jgi:hypothetical protein
VVNLKPARIHVGDDVTFDATQGDHVVNGWEVDYGDTTIPATFEDYFTRITHWTSKFSDTASTVGSIETVPGANFAAAGAYRVQLTATSNADFSTSVTTYYFQVAPPP